MVLLGEPGIGKSTVLKVVLIKMLMQLTHEPWRAHLLHVGSRDSPDNTGMLSVFEEQGQKVAGWAKPKQIPGAIHWLNDDGTPAGWTLGILDELPSAKPEVQDQIREMIDGTVPGSGDPVDPRCVYIAAGNPPEAKHITAHIIDDAIEKRFKVYAVIPTTEELLQVWSDHTIMPDILYKFLMVNTAAIEHLSPREWEGAGKDARYMLDMGGSRNDALNEIADELQDYPDVITALNVYFEHGDDPSYYPIRGTQLLTADDDDFKEYERIMRVWVGDRSREALLGASMNDLQRALKLTPDSDLKGNKQAVKNVYAVLEFLAASGRPDMVKAVTEVVFATPLVKPVGSRMRKSAHLKDMDAAASRANAFGEKMGAATRR
jgi:hypothetical protein